MNWSLLAKRLRLPLGFLFGILYLIFARPLPASLMLGGAVAFAGVLVRGWASGHIIKNDRLATSGPFPAFSAVTKRPFDRERKLIVPSPLLICSKISHVPIDPRLAIRAALPADSAQT